MLPYVKRCKNISTIETDSSNFCEVQFFSIKAGLGLGFLIQYPIVHRLRFRLDEGWKRLRLKSLLGPSPISSIPTWRQIWFQISNPYSTMNNWEQYRSCLGSGLSRAFLGLQLKIPAPYPINPNIIQQNEKRKQFGKQNTMHVYIAFKCKDAAHRCRQQRIGIVPLVLMRTRSCKCYILQILNYTQLIMSKPIKKTEIRTSLYSFGTIAQWKVSDSYLNDSLRWLSIGVQIKVSVKIRWPTITLVIYGKNWS